MVSIIFYNNLAGFSYILKAWGFEQSIDCSFLVPFLWSLYNNLLRLLCYFWNNGQWVHTLYWIQTVIISLVKSGTWLYLPQRTSVSFSICMEFSFKLAINIQAVHGSVVFENLGLWTVWMHHNLISYCMELWKPPYFKMSDTSTDGFISFEYVFVSILADVSRETFEDVLLGHLFQ